MKSYKEPLDTYDYKPEAMKAYLRYNGWHFNQKMCQWAASLLRKKTGGEKLERLDPWPKEVVDSMLKSANVQLENKNGYDYVYVANIAQCLFYGNVLPNNEYVAKFIKATVDDCNHSDGFIFNRFYSDTIRDGEQICWEEMI